MKLIKLASSIALGAALLTGTVACSNNHSDDNQTTQKSTTKKSPEKKTESSKTSSSEKVTPVEEDIIKTDAKKIKLSQQDALDKFNGQFKNKHIKSIDLKLEGNQYVYEIDGFDSTHEYTAEVNAETGQVSRARSEKLDMNDKNEQKALNLNSVISRDEASKIAEKHAKGTSQEWNLEMDEDTGKAYWDVEVSNGTKVTGVKIDAHSKAVVTTDHDDNDD